MKKGIRILYFITVVISALVGLWHFFVPWMFQWYDYLPMQYENLIVGIDYTNYCFSLLLFGLSVLLIMLGKRALAMNREVIYFYFFLTVVWVFRACLASFVEPWPLQPIPVAAIGQLIASDVQAVLMLIVSGLFFKSLKRKASIPVCRTEYKDDPSAVWEHPHTADTYRPPIQTGMRFP